MFLRNTGLTAFSQISQQLLQFASIKCTLELKTHKKKLRYNYNSEKLDW